MDIDNQKAFRLLNLFERLSHGEVVNKKQFAEKFSVSEKTVQRDIDDLRAYFVESYGVGNALSIKYDKARCGYYLKENQHECLTNAEVLSLIKILLESRALNKKELNHLINKLLLKIPIDSRKLIKELILNEMFNYVELQHKKDLLNLIWELSLLIHKKEIISFNYIRKDGVSKSHCVKPITIMFSEYYFYLVSYMADKELDCPTIFRLDRISFLKGTGIIFTVPYLERLQEGELRKRVQFMYTGPLRYVRFEYHGPSVEAVLDRLPTAKIVSEFEGIYVIEAEVYGSGIEMWLRSQGDYIQNISYKGGK